MNFKKRTFANIDTTIKQLSLDASIVVLVSISGVTAATKRGG